MRARYYKPDIKRFISLDTLHGDILNPQALNRYAYVLGNPVMGMDPSGMEMDRTKTVPYFIATTYVSFVRKLRIPLKTITGTIKKNGQSLGNDIDEGIDLIASGNVDDGFRKINFSLAFNVGGGMVDSINPFAYTQNFVEALIDELQITEAEKQDLKFVNSIVFLAVSVTKFAKSAKEISSGADDVLKNISKYKRKMLRAKEALKQLKKNKMHGKKAKEYKKIIKKWKNATKASYVFYKNTAWALGGDYSGFIAGIRGLQADLESMEE